MQIKLYRIVLRTTAVQHYSSILGTRHRCCHAVEKIKSEIKSGKDLGVKVKNTEICVDCSQKKFEHQKQSLPL